MSQELKFTFFSLILIRLFILEKPHSRVRRRSGVRCRKYTRRRRDDNVACCCYCLWERWGGGGVKSKLRYVTRQMGMTKNWLDSIDIFHNNLSKFCFIYVLKQFFIFYFLCFSIFIFLKNVFPTGCCFFGEVHFLPPLCFADVCLSHENFSVEMIRNLQGLLAPQKLGGGIKYKSLWSEIVFLSHYLSKDKIWNSKRKAREKFEFQNLSTKKSAFKERCNAFSPRLEQLFYHSLFSMLFAALWLFRHIFFNTCSQSYNKSLFIRRKEAQIL